MLFRRTSLFRRFYLVLSKIFKTYDNFYLYSEKLGYVINVNEVFYSIFEYSLSNLDQEVINKFSNTYARNELKSALKRIRYYQSVGIIPSLDSNETLSISKIVDENKIEELYAECSQLTFQVTESCQLECNYCFNGHFYSESCTPSTKKISFETAKVVIDDKLSKWKKLRGAKRFNVFYVSFYGGEPLLNFDVIQKIVNYINDNNDGLYIQYNMTTNGLLLNQYSDFLIDNNFQLLISLDGDEAANVHRVFYNGSQSFNKVVENCDHIKEKNSTFFKNKVNFNSVFTSSSNLKNILTFFSERYNKIPTIQEINGDSILPDKSKEFEEIDANLLVESVKYMNEKSSYEVETSPESLLETIVIFFKEHGIDYCQKLPGSTVRDFSSIRNGTCMPFMKEVYVSCDGEIYPCEKLSNPPVLGIVENNKIVIKHKEVAEEFNELMRSKAKQCVNCVSKTSCNQCYYSCFTDKGCKFFANSESFNRKFTNQLWLLENYYHLMREYV